MIMAGEIDRNEYLQEEWNLEERSRGRQKSSIQGRNDLQEHNNLQIIGWTLEYIEKNLLEDKMNLESIAQAAGYSKYHLHRMFGAIVGLTIHSYIVRRRLTEAAWLLIYTDRPILEIALLAGYDTQRSFSSGFKALYSHSPGAYRRRAEFLPIQLKYEIKNKNGLRGDRMMEVKTVEEKAIDLVGYDGNTKKGFWVIGNCWKKLHKNKGKIAGRINTGFLIGVNDYSAFEEGEKNPAFHYIAAAEVGGGEGASEEKLPRGMKRFILPAGKYLVFSFRGKNEDSLQPVTEYIYQQWFPNSTCRFDETRMYDFAEYGEVTDEKGESEIRYWVPIV